MGRKAILSLAALTAALLASSCQESKETAKAKESVPTPVEEKAAPAAAKPEAPAKAEAKPAAEAGAWKWCGWGGGGFFWCCAADPSNPDVLYLGGDVAGMYKSVDKGKSWRFINKGISDYGVYSVAVSKSAPQVVYIMTVNGMCRSSDGGESWAPLEETLKSKLDISVKRHSTVRGIAIDPGNPDIVYAGSKKGELYKTLDGGATWKKLSYLPKSDASEEQAKLDSGEIVLVGDFEGGAKNEGWEANTKYESKLSDSVSASGKFAYSGKGSLEINFNAGSASWKDSGRVQKYYGGKDFSKFKTLAARFYVPEGAPKLLGQLVVQSGDKWLWQAGERVEGIPGKWSDVRLDLGNLTALNDVKAIYFIVMSPYSPYSGKVYLDSVAFQASADKIDLAKLSKSGDNGVISSVDIAQKNPKLLFASNAAKGVYRSSDAGETWTQMKLPDAATNVKVAPSDEKQIYASFTEGRLMKSSDGGETWSSACEGIDPKYMPYEILVHPKNPDKLWCAANKSWSGKIYKSDDGGKTWQSDDQFKADLIGDPTLPKEHEGYEIESGMRKFSTLTNIALSEADPNTILASANWRNVISYDGGKTWEESSRGADITCTQDVFFLKDKAFAVAMDEGLFVSEDGGSQWRQLAPLKYLPEISGHQWRVWAAEKDGKLKIVSTCSPWNASPNSNRILISEDGGNNFKVVKQGLPNYISKVNCMWGRSYPRALAVAPSDSNVMYLGIDGDPEPAKGLSGGGVFKSGDGGYSWTQLPNQPPSRRMFFGLAVDPTNPKRLLWGCCGDKGGLYVSEDAGGSWSKRDGVGDTWVFNALFTPKGTAYCSGNNLWASYDGCKTWTKLLDNKLGTIVGIAFDPANESRLFISCVTWGENASGAIQMSEDGGKTWKDITGDIPYKKPIILRYNPETKELWAAGVGIFKLKI